jgi:LacI family transcriptional regulator/LacI family repressor for deo operon, udp, cdd, tsx, nupC, and nupG
MNTTKRTSNDEKRARGRVSIKDIAQTAGVSHPTVSRALNNSPLINKETRARIKAIALEMGYIPNAVARSLKAQRSGTMGLVVTSLTDPFFSEVMAGVDEVASEAGLSMFVTASHNDPEREMEVIETFHRRRVEGIIVAASRLSSRYHQRLERIQIPIVLINQHTEDTQPRFHSVAFDEQAGAKLAAEHLLLLGHRRIGYLGLGNRQRSNRLRLAGYREALRETGIDANPAWALVVPEDEIQARGDNDVGESSCPSLLNSGVTAVLCYNDRVAIGALEACRSQGLAVPGTVSIVGFDDVELARWVSPALTTIRQPRLKMGCVAMKMILDLLDDRPVDNRSLQPQLIIRQSSAPPT